MGLLVFGLAVILIAIVAANAPTHAPGSAVAIEAGAPRVRSMSKAPAAAADRVLPLPKGMTGSPARSTTTTTTEDIRRQFELNDAARIALMHVAGSFGAGSKFDFGDGTDTWVIVETDRKAPIFGPDSNNMKPVARYCWSFVTTELKPRDGLCISYSKAEDVPALPG